MANKQIPFLVMSMIFGVILCGPTAAQDKPKIAVFAGGNATVQNGWPEGGNHSLRRQCRSGSLSES